MSKSEKSNISLVVNNPGLPDYLQNTMLEDAGKGVSHAQEDNIVPLIYILQSASPVLKKSSPTYVEGAAAGDIWLRNSAQEPVIEGDKGILFQPCHFEKVWIEWRPNKGGFAGSHRTKPADAQQKTKLHEGREVSYWERHNGNEIVETRQMAGYANGQPYVIPFSSTGHTVARSWMQLLNQQIIPGSNKVAPSWAKCYKLTTVERSNNQGSWFVFKVEDAGWVSSMDEYNKGKTLHDAFDSGTKAAAVDQGIEESEDTSIPF